MDLEDDDNVDFPIGNSIAGFQKWIRLSVDDFPPIRPPRRHMLSHVTGGLTELYSSIKEEEKRKEKINGQVENNSISPLLPKKEDVSEAKVVNNDNEANGTKKSSTVAEEKSKASRRDDEGGGDVDMASDDDEETSPYTDEEGEFCPDKSIPLLASRYKYVEVLARGQSALIIKALDTFAKNKPIAIKVLHRVYKPIGSQEADILLEVHRADPWLHVPFARLLNQFIYGPHYCLVFDFLSPTPLYTHYDQKEIRGPTSLPHVRNLCVKLLTVLGFLHKQNVIHADLKPENILLVNEEDMSSVMVIDFGNALRNTEEELSLYYTDFELQTLLYRAPEVIFGLKFSLEIDMWSLGCLLAECYTGEPLFMGKTKDDILMKMTKLLGPFPKEFSVGECAEEFSLHIGKVLTRYQRVENLRKRLNNCQDINFLLLLERLLTYIPNKRISPFEAACHPFVASVNPFLYLSSSEEHKRYPTVVLDMTTYPYLPEFPKDDSNPVAVKGRKRLEAYSKSLFAQGNASLCNHRITEKSEPLSTSISHNNKTQPIPPLLTTVAPTITTLAASPIITTADITTSATVSTTAVSSTVAATTTITSVPTVTAIATTADITTATATTAVVTTTTAITSTAKPQVSPSQVSDHPKSTQVQLSHNQPATKAHSPPPKTNSEESIKLSKESSNSKPHPDASQPLLSPSLPSPTPSQSSLTEPLHPPMSVSPTPSTSSESSQTQTIPVQSKVQIDRRPSKTHTKEELLKITQLQEQMQSGNYSRTDVKQTLKSMGLRCEDFTISVYSKEQAHAILRKQGVEVTNHAPSRSNQNVMSKGNPRQIKGNSGVRPSVSVVRSEANRAPTHSTPQKKTEEDDDDDDCIILDPPEGPKLPPPPPPVRRFPQQFQLMGTTVQVNRGSKRQMRAMPRQAPMSKRPHRPRPSYYYNDGYNYEESAETSVQDTLKRLKNYNISITCRRNSSQKNPRMVDSDDEMDHEGGHLDSEDEEDMAKYLECEIDEEKEHLHDGDESYDLDSSGSIADISYDDTNDHEIEKKRKRKIEHEKLNKTVELEEEKEVSKKPSCDEPTVETSSCPTNVSLDDHIDKDKICSELEVGKNDLDEISSDKIDKEKLETKNIPVCEEETNKVVKLVTPDSNEVSSESVIESTQSDLSESKSAKIVEAIPEKNGEFSVSGKKLLVVRSSKDNVNFDDNEKKKEKIDLSADISESSEKDTEQLDNLKVAHKPHKELTADAGNIDDEDINEELENQLLESGENLDDDDLEGENLENLDLESEL